MADDTPDALPTSPEEAFAERVRAFLAIAARGQAEAFHSALEEDPALASALGPHPFWGGGATAFQIAAEWGRLDHVRTLLDADADPNADAAAYDNWSALHCALAKQYGDIADLLIERGARVDIWSASMMGDVDAARRLLDEDPELVNRPGPSQGTPLHFAANVEVAQLLLNRGADPHALDRYGATPARSAAYAGLRRRDVALLLLAAAHEDDPFIDAAVGRLDALASRLDANPDLLHARDRHLGPASASGGTLLHFAAAIGDADLAKLVLSRGTPADIRSLEGETPLHLAARNGHAALACLLLESGASADALDAHHKATPRDWAEFFRQSALVELLDKHRAAD